MPLASDARGAGTRAEVPAQGSKLLSRATFDAVDELDRTNSALYDHLQEALSGVTDSETHSTLQEKVSEGPSQHSDVINGLLYGILTESDNAPKLFGYLNSVTRDDHSCCLATLQRLVLEKWGKLLEGVKIQLVWILRQLVGLAAGDVEALCLSLLRQVAGGDLSTSNVWLASQLLDLMQSNRSWLYNSPALLSTALYTYLRLLPDHAAAKNLADLRQSETAFCIQLLRERFRDCLVIGRDLIRLLQDVACIPEFEPLWRDLLSNPGALGVPSFSDLAQLYVVRTPTRYLVSRVTPEMESQLRFLLTHVRMGCQRRYQAWFAQRFLATPESEGLVCDLIRFICCAVHPPNQILQSDIIPRWAVVGWLLKCCKSAHVEANAKLALLYDWLFFIPKTDNIMNIEPAILLMVHSIPKYADITNSLLECLFLLLDHYDPARQDVVQRGLAASVSILVGKGVVRSLEPLAMNPLVAPQLRERLLTHFPAYCRPEPLKGQPVATGIRPLPGHDSGRISAQTHSTSVSTEVPTTGGLSAIGFRLAPTDNRGGESEALGSTREQTGAAGPSPTHSGGTESRGIPSWTEGGGHEAGTKSAAIQVPISPLKRKRSFSSEDAALELRSALEQLGEATRKSPDAAVAHLEHVLVTCNSIWDRLAGGKQHPGAGGTEHEEGGAGGPGEGSVRLLPNGHVEHGTFAGPFAASSIAQQITGVLAKAGYQLFAPLREMPSGVPGDDETGSLSSTLLRTYVANSHPELRKLLLTLQREHVQVSSRLLCYVCRLAEELGQLRDPVGQRGDTRMSPRVQAGTDASSVSALEGVGEAGEEDGHERERLERVLSSSSAGPANDRGRNLAVDKRGLPRRREVRNYEEHDMHARGQVAVADAFRVYEDFLRDLAKNNPSLGAGSNDPHTARGDSIGSADRSSGADEQAQDELPPSRGVDALLVADLGTCLLWNAYRMLRFLPAVFRYLPHLATGNEEVVRLLLGVADPLEVGSMETQLALGEYAIIGQSLGPLTYLVKASIAWESQEQQWFWQLLGAEALGWTLDPVLAVVQAVGDSLEAGPCPDAISGMLRLLRSRPPSAALLAAMLCLPQSCALAIAAALNAWAVSHHSLLCTLLHQSAPCLNTKEGTGHELEGNGQVSSGGGAIRFLPNKEPCRMDSGILFLQSVVKRRRASALLAERERLEELQVALAGFIWRGEGSGRKTAGVASGAGSSPMELEAGQILEDLEQAGVD